MPEKSALVLAITKAVPGALSFHRFPWSGRNRVHDHLEAADRLREFIQLELNAADRLVFILAHSHGGNVAMKAIDGLSEEQQRSVRSVLMATPFLKTLRRFDVRDVFKLLPRIVQFHLQWICLLGTWIGSLILMMLFQERFIPENLRLPLFGGEVPSWKLPILLFFTFLPFFLFNWIWRRLYGFIKELPADMAQSGSKPRFGQSKNLVLAYSQDEAFQALSVVINLLSLVHQAFFICIVALAWTSSRIKLVAWLSELVV